MANGFAAGGQLTTTTDGKHIFSPDADVSNPAIYQTKTSPPPVENFPGFPDGVLGADMMEKLRAQSLRFGTQIITETISKVDLSSRPFKYWREWAPGEDEFETADTIILATGASAKRMNIPGEDKYWNNGISACAVCDGAVPIFR